MKKKTQAKRNFRSYALIIGVIVMTISSAALAGPFRGNREDRSPLRQLIMGNMGRLMTLRSELDVTDQQREEIKTVIEKRKTEIRKVTKEIVTAKRALSVAVLAEKPSSREIRAAADNLGGAIGEASIVVSDIALEIREILTDDQIEKLKEFSEKRDESVDKWLDEMLESQK